jgi:hypothetical protein
MAREEVRSRIEYRGYLLIERLYSGVTTVRIRRPDGTWYSSLPK